MTDSKLPVVAKPARVDWKKHAIELRKAHGGALVRIAELEALARGILQDWKDEQAKVTEEVTKREVAAARAEAAEARAVALRQALIDARATLERHNVAGVILDTIWHGPAETLFDFMDAAIEAAG